MDYKTCYRDTKIVFAYKYCIKLNVIENNSTFILFIYYERSGEIRQSMFIRFKDDFLI